MSSVGERLAEGGLSAPEIEKKRKLFAQAERALGGAGNARLWFVPGRIEVLGKHTDYAGGRSLLCATERGMCLAALPRHDSVVRVTDLLHKDAVEFPLSPAIEIPAGWGNYVATVVRRLARNFQNATDGVEIAFVSDLPLSAGLSSSSVLVTAIFTAIAERNQLRQSSSESLSHGEQIAGYLGCIENGQSYGSLGGDRGVGTFGGSEDHTAILCSRAGDLSRYRFCPIVREDTVAVPAGWTFAIAYSGVRATKTGAARDLYNRASHLARAALAAWNQRSGRSDVTLAAAVNSAASAGEIRDALRSGDYEGVSAAELCERFDQFVLESEELVPAATAAFTSTDIAGLGSIVERSQEAAERWLQNQVPETIALAREARSLGAAAASAFGAGFGGSVWALVQSSEAERFLREWQAMYTHAFPARRPDFFLTSAGPGLTVVR